MLFLQNFTRKDERRTRVFDFREVPLWRLPAIDTSSLNEEECFSNPAEDDLYAQLESGSLHENITDECLSPTRSSKVWKQYTMKKVTEEDSAPNSRCYELYDTVTSEFVLSARKNETGAFEIARYRSEVENKRANFCAILQPDGKHGFSLLSCSCECCDKHLNRFSCLGITNPAIEHSKSFGQHHHFNHLSPSSGRSNREGRQVLAHVSQRLAVEENTGTEMRALEVELPALLNTRQLSPHLRPTVPTSPVGDGLERVVWCPRSPRKGVPGSPRPTQQKGATKFVTKLPHYSEAIGCLTMDFATDRVQTTSTKNFMLVEEGGGQFGPNHTTLTGPGGADDSDLRRGVLQFGKDKDKTYSLDVRHPLAPVQAFGISLAMCNWRVKGEQLKETS